MFTENDLRELAEFVAPASVLSVYLNTEPEKGNADAYKLRLRNMLKEVEMPKDVDAVEQYINHQYDWSGRGVIMFSCTSEGLFRAYQVAVSIRNLVNVGDRPSVKAMMTLLDSYGGYGVALVDRQETRLFSFHLGELREEESMVGERVKRLKKGGGSSAGPGRRSGSGGRHRAMSEQIDRNMKAAAEFASNFFAESKIRRVLIGGTDDNVALFRSNLPKSWQSLIVGSFPMNMSASHVEVLKRTMEIGKEAEKRRIKKLVDDLITAVAKGGQAVVGLEDTLSTIKGNRVNILIVTEGYREAGYRCVECGNVLTTDQSCSICGGKVEAVADVIDLAASAVLGLGGDVEVVQPSTKFDEVGNVGAILRY